MKTITSFASRIRLVVSSVEPVWILLGIVSILFLGLMVASNQPPEHPAIDVVAQSAELTPTPQPALTTEFSNTPIPQEYLANATQTNGIIFGSVILVLIIIIGTLGVMLRRDNRRQ